jgi:adenylate kinase
MADKVVIVSGVPGAGKSTILKELSNIEGVHIVNMGTLMLETAKEEGFMKGRDDIRFLSNKEITRLRTQAVKKITLMAGKVIIDTHVTIGENGRYVPGLPISALEKTKNITGLIYIEAPVKDIIERRKADATRVRENEDEITVENQRHLNLAMLSVASTYLNVPIFIVINRQGDLKKTVAEIKARLEELFGD